MTRTKRRPLVPAELIYKLKHPYRSPVGTKDEISTIKLRTLITVDDQISIAKMGGTGAEQDRALVARCAGLLPEEIGPMSLRDFNHLNRKLAEGLVDDEDPKDV
jgi:hypothetical protein